MACPRPHTHHFYSWVSSFLWDLHPEGVWEPHCDEKPSSLESGGVQRQDLPLSATGPCVDASVL